MRKINEKKSLHSDQEMLYVMYVMERDLGQDHLMIVIILYLSIIVQIVKDLANLIGLKIYVENANL